MPTHAVHQPFSQEDALGTPRNARVSGARLLRLGEVDVVATPPAWRERLERGSKGVVGVHALAELVDVVDVIGERLDSESCALCSDGPPDQCLEIGLLGPDLLDAREGHVPDGAVLTGLDEAAPWVLNQCAFDEARDGVVLPGTDDDNVPPVVHVAGVSPLDGLGESFSI